MRATQHAVDTVPALVLVFASVRYNLEQLIGGVQEVVGDALLVGCTTAGEIGADGPICGGCSIMALYGMETRYSVAVAEKASEDLREAGASVARQVRMCISEEVPYQYRAFMILVDSLSGDQREVVRGAYEELGAEIPLVGGAAGDDYRVNRTYQFYDGRVLTDSVIGVLISSHNPIGIGVEHGWKEGSRPYTVTRAFRNVIYELDGEPALEVYKREVGTDLSSMDQAEFIQRVLLNPLGIPQLYGEHHMRHIIARTEDGGMVTFAEIARNTIVHIMRGELGGVLQASRRSCIQAAEQLQGRSPCAVLAFSCASRKVFLGDEAGREIEILHETLGRDTPLAGFYTYGEIARVWGVIGFHNETLTVLALS